jgi:hypothetical protein
MSIMEGFQIVSFTRALVELIIGEIMKNLVCLSMTVLLKLLVANNRNLEYLHVGFQRPVGLEFLVGGVLMIMEMKFSLAIFGFLMPPRVCG